MPAVIETPAAQRAARNALAILTLRHQEGAHAHIRLDLSPVGNLSAEADIAFEAPEEPLWTACELGWREQATLEVVNLKKEAMK